MVVNWGWQSMIQLFLVVAVVATLVTIRFAVEDSKGLTPTVPEVPVGV